jgi:(p)ppGpp synthase/HD superfamily hydrolase
METRLRRTAERAGLAPADVDMIARAFDVAMAHRQAWIDDSEHPDYLHTARTALILFDDAGCTDARTLAAAAVFDSSDGLLVPSADAIASATTDAVAALTRSVPTPTGARDDLLEWLVAAGREAGVIAVADHLDHARHLHLRARERWRDFHSLSVDVYLPVAGRVNAALERRLAWWCDMFGARYLGGTAG